MTSADLTSPSRPCIGPGVAMTDWAVPARLLARLLARHAPPKLLPSPVTVPECPTRPYSHSHMSLTTTPWSRPAPIAALLSHV